MKAREDLQRCLEKLGWNTTDGEESAALTGDEGRIFLSPNFEDVKAEIGALLERGVMVYVVTRCPWPKHEAVKVFRLIDDLIDYLERTPIKPSTVEARA